MPVAVINEAMALRFFAGDDPIGKRIRVKGVTDPKGWMTIVGVARDIRDEASTRRRDRRTTSRRVRRRAPSREAIRRCPSS